MIDRPSTIFRENFPLFAVGLVLLGVFVALALFGEIPSDNAARAERPILVRSLAALPASPEDNRTTVSILAPGDARARNAAVPFVEEKFGPAKAFSFHGSSTDRDRARQCLALAALAEAGTSETGQRAVMQVVLNRVRHPAFANTVCGVVFEGSERATGCQFSFTCDGSLARTYPDALWDTARKRAAEALGGRVYTPVGGATHYHADYVYPWWSDELDKIARVGPHLFFRWRGAWGERGVLSARYRGGEPDPEALQARAEAMDRPSEIWPRLSEDGEAVRTISASAQPAAASSASSESGSLAPGAHFVLVEKGDDPARLIERARALCPGTRFCQVYGWDDVAVMPQRLPLTPEARTALKFSFLPARGGNAEAIYFDCRAFSVPAVGRCLPKPRN